MNPPEPTKGELTRERIQNAAHNLFLRQGYAATSMRQIAAASDLTVGGIYAHYTNKEAIWEDVFVRFHPFHQVLPILVAAKGETAAEAIRAAAYELVGGMIRSEDLLNLTFIEIVEFGGRHFSRIFREAFPQLLEMSRRLQAMQGDMRDIPPPVLARSFIGLFFSYFLTEALLQPEIKRFYPPDTLDRFVDIYLYGVLAGSGPERR